MKKVKVLRIRYQDMNSQALVKVENTEDISVDSLDDPISKEVVKKKPSRISNDGFNTSVRKIKNTDNGMESIVIEPMLIASSGQRVGENEIKGQCIKCGGYDNYIFNCHIDGCKKPLCLKHTYFYEFGEKKTPFCLEHFQQAMNGFDTWQDYENKIKLKGNI